MNTQTHAIPYALGYTAEEQDRLIRQSARIAPWTRRLFRKAGIGPGHRVLDVGSGMGDVSLILSELVGKDGSVVGLERDAGSIAAAQKRMEAAGVKNVAFLQADALNPPVTGKFDAVVGRFILMYMPDPVIVLRGLVDRLIPGGIVAFMEPSWAPARAIAAHLPVYSMISTIVVDCFVRSGVSPELGTALHRIFIEAWLPAPGMKMELILGSDPDIGDALVHILGSLAPQAVKRGVSLEPLGDLSTLRSRLQAELGASKQPIPYLAAAAGAWCRKAT
jgi:ubiquinone/menaquinone biosynthesis C-methylase UbiE